MEPEVDEGHVNPLSLTADSHSLIDISTKQETVTDSLAYDSSQTVKKEGSCLNERKKIDYGKAKVLCNDNWGVNEFDNKPFSMESNSTLAYADAYGHVDVGSKTSATNSIQTPTKNVENVKQISPRLNAPPTRARSSLYSNGFDGENVTPFDVANKRLRIVCEFHAKGWCIRGRSCRFIHTKNGLDAAEFKNYLYDAEGHISGTFMKNTPSVDYKTTKYHDNWEPSVPFRPSHVITKKLLLKESLYDPLLDSIEQTENKNKLVEYSNSGKRIDDNKADLEFHGRHEGKLLNIDHVEDTPKANSLGFDDDSLPNFDKSEHQSDPHLDGSFEKTENDIEIKKTLYVLSESKAHKYFRAALVESVKELVKPTWLKGFMSKDAHKIIVKSSVDKIMRPMQPHQIPNTAESIKSYLSLSQNKLSKLVEVYIEKYGKS